jgi:hypothetical protein
LGAAFSLAASTFAGGVLPAPAAPPQPDFPAALPVPLLPPQPLEPKAEPGVAAPAPAMRPASPSPANSCFKCFSPICTSPVGFAGRADISSVAGLVPSTRRRCGWGRGPT